MTEPTVKAPANLAAALAAVQAELPTLDRDRTVVVEPKDPKKDTYSYSYVTLAKLTEAVLPVLSKHGLAFASLPGTGSDGKMCLHYHLLHSSGEALSGEFPISGEGGIQMIGGRITYARRYCLAALVGVAADEDDEARLTEEGPRTTAQRAAQPRKAAPASTRATAQRARPASAPPLPGEVDGVTEGQLKKVVIGFDELGVTDRGERLHWTSGLVGGRQLGSAKDLTKAEAHQLIDDIEAALKESDPFAHLAGLVEQRSGAA